MLAGIEATLETAKTDGIKPESVAAVKAMIHQLMRNNGVREYWMISGRNLFAPLARMSSPLRTGAQLVTLYHR